MSLNKGFSLLEVSIVIFITGMTITALLQMFDWSHDRYREINLGWQERSSLAEIRVWLRDRILFDETANIDVKELKKAVKMPEGLLIQDVKLSQYGDYTYLVKLIFFEDRNRNGKADKSEQSDRIFCFRRRSA